MNHLNTKCAVLYTNHRPVLWLEFKMQGEENE